MSRRRAPRPAANAFEAALQRAAPKTPLAAVQTVWPKVAGNYMARVTIPVAERDGTVTIECADAVSAQEFNLMQETLLERLREALGEEAPQALRFRVNSERF
jgi:predicted nucleic acid-binding Zn ribbon protein